MSARTVSRAVEEGGVAAKIQTVFKLALNKVARDFFDFFDVEKAIYLKL
jgi:hypothetical protein